MTTPSPPSPAPTRPFWRSLPFLLLLAMDRDRRSDPDPLGPARLRKRAYIARNQEIHDTLPLFPGALLLETQTSTYYGDAQFSPTEGHTTHATYRIPPGTTWDNVLGFYENEMVGLWDARFDSGGLIVVNPNGEAAPATPSSLARSLSARRGTILLRLNPRALGPGNPPPTP